MKKYEYELLLGKLRKKYQEVPTWEKKAIVEKAEIFKRYYKPDLTK